MFSVQIKNYMAIILTAVLTISCTDKAAEDAMKAEDLYNQTCKYFENGNYEQAKLLLDSIDRAYPQAYDVRKLASRLRPQLMERWTARKLSITDSLLVENQLCGINLREQLIFVKNPLEGYYVVSSMGNVKVRETAGLHGRISPAFKFYLTASCPVKIGSTTIRLESDGESIVSSTVSYDGERNNRSGKCETITFTEAESAPLGEFVKNHANSKIDLIYIASNNKEQRTTMTEANKNAIIIGYSYAQTVIRDKQLQIEKERLEKQIELSRMQIARTQSTEITQ